MRLFILSCLGVAALATLGCQQAAPAPKVEKKLNLLGDLETTSTNTAVSTSLPLPSSDGVIVNNLGMRLAPVQPGTFTMGSPMNEPGRQDDEFQHSVQITKRFHIGTTEVTQSQWMRVMGTEPWRGQRGITAGKEQPATHMSYSEAVQFCVLLGRMENAMYRLPTEAEWELACRGGMSGAYNVDGALKDIAWIDANTENAAMLVAKKKANALGLHDMHGNVAEWCADWYATYPRQSVTDPAGPATGEYRVVRGGAWDGAARFCRSAYRSGTDPQTKSNAIGLRVVLVK